MTVAADRKILIDIIVKDRGLVRASLDNIETSTLEAEVRKIHERKTVELIKTQVKQQADVEAATVIEQERQQLRQQQAEVAAEANWTDILRTWFGSGQRLKNILANRSAIEREAELQGQQPTVKWLKQFFTDNPKFAGELLWEEYKQVPDTPEQRAKDRGVFESVAKSRNLSTHDLGFKLVREKLGPGFTSKDVERLLDSGKITLSVAKDEDKSKWASEQLIDAYQSGDNLRLATFVKRALESNDDQQLATLRNIKVDSANKYRMDVLRAIAAVETEYFRVTRQHVKGSNNDAATTNPNAPKSYSTSDLTPVERVDTRVYKPLTAEISAGDIKKANPADLRRMVQMYGNKQVNDRLRAA